MMEFCLLLFVMLLFSIVTQNPRLGAQPVSCLSASSNTSVSTMQSIGTCMLTFGYLLKTRAHKNGRLE